ncbi:high mobility group B protein 7-like [Eucalyptus grandis]|uniref:high mobility group B protein 7-like n=1 Tax=Eucalyptus grandis TaxID=71139 RepID=UPI00192F030B|nr:high mobility group B protein 7-like [Eucalyptus grandis]
MEGSRKYHPIAFSLFLEDFRKRRMEEFESTLQKDAPKEWDSLLEEEKMTYQKKAMERVASLMKGLEIYNKLGVEAAD